MMNQFNRYIICLIFFLTVSCNREADKTVNEKTVFSPLNIEYDINNPNTAFINNDSNLHGKSIWFVSKQNKNPDIKIQFDNEGNVVFIKRYIDTVLNGQSVWFYPSGNIKNLVLFKNGKADGNTFYFFEKGSIQKHGFWKDDKASGYVTTYFDDSIGRVKSVSFYDSTGKLVNTKTVK